MRVVFVCESGSMFPANVSNCVPPTHKGSEKHSSYRGGKDETYFLCIIVPKCPHLVAFV